MAKMTYRDVPVVRAAGFQSSWSGLGWFGKDLAGADWYVDEDLDTGLLMFDNTRDSSRTMDREEFDQIFLVKSESSDE